MAVQYLVNGTDIAENFAGAKELANAYFRRNGYIVSIEEA